MEGVEDVFWLSAHLVGVVVFHLTGRVVVGVVVEGFPIDVFWGLFCRYVGVVCF